MIRNPQSRHDELVFQVAAIAQVSGFTAVPEADVSGIQVDLLLKRGRGRSHTKTLVECKAYTRLVGLRTLRPFLSTFQFLKETGEVDGGWLITTEGFTPRVRDLAEGRDIRLWTFTEFREKYPQPEERLNEEVQALRSRWESLSHRKKRVFVIMPFKPEMEDVFILGIRWVAKELGIVVRRSDDLLHGGEIIDVIKDAIRTYDGVIGDTTGANANVCYEIGYAHALERPTVLICRDGEKLPFDLQGVNHIFYVNILELRDRLPMRLKVELGL